MTKRFALLRYAWPPKATGREQRLTETAEPPGQRNPDPKIHSTMCQ